MCYGFKVMVLSCLIQLISLFIILRHIILSGSFLSQILTGPTLNISVPTSALMYKSVKPFRDLHAIQNWYFYMLNINFLKNYMIYLRLILKPLFFVVDRYEQQRRVNTLYSWLSPRSSKY